MLACCALWIPVDFAAGVRLCSLPLFDFVTQFGQQDVIPGVKNWHTFLTACGSRGASLAGMPARHLHGHCLPMLVIKQPQGHDTSWADAAHPDETCHSDHIKAPLIDSSWVASTLVVLITRALPAVDPFKLPAPSLAMLQVAFCSLFRAKHCETSAIKRSMSPTQQ
jgi:hypothetical protein